MLHVRPSRGCQPAHRPATGVRWPHEPHPLRRRGVDHGRRPRHRQNQCRKAGIRDALRARRRCDPRASCGITKESAHEYCRCHRLCGSNCIESRPMLCQRSWSRTRSRRRAPRAMLHMRRMCPPQMYQYYPLRIHAPCLPQIRAASPSIPISPAPPTGNTDACSGPPPRTSRCGRARRALPS